MAYLSDQTGVINPKKSIKQGTSALVFVPDLDKVSQAGLSVDAVGLWSRILGAGFTLPEVNFEEGSTEKTPVRFTFTAGNSSPEDLGRLMIQTSSGPVPLLSLGEITLRNNPTAITRSNSKRTITVTAALRPGYSATEKGQALEQFADGELALPAGYAWKTGGVNEENQKSVQSILQAMGVAFLLILVTMVIQFKSFRQAAIVLLVIPLAVSSVFYAFALTGTPLSFPALIGVLSLFGIVVTNSMFIVDKINLNKKEGMTFNDAISDAGASRLEPIVLTKLTAVVGLLPITLSNLLWRGLGGAIISGLLVSSTIMLLFIPVVYYQLFKGESTKRQ
jgi:HAE1 family hydrophobic/amphiphilic exporter-1